MTSEIGEAYNRSANAWRRGPARLYARLAEAWFGHPPAPIEGAVVLDAGAGTGVAGDAARARGAKQVIAVDLAAAMLPTPAVVADLTRLPFRDHAFDLAVAGFVLGHLPEPEAGLRELRRVAPALLASAFEEGWKHPAKQVVERVLERHGYRPPPWYAAFKGGSERTVGDRLRLASLARAAGYSDERVDRIEVVLGRLEPAELVAWRLGMAHHAPFLATLAPSSRDAIRREAEKRLAGGSEVVVPVLVLSAT